MLGYSQMQLFDRLKERADALGFEVQSAKFGENFLTLSPVGDELPLYSRDADLYNGDVQSLLSFMHGIIWAREYDEMIKLSNTDKRQEKEQKIKNRQLLAKLIDEV